MENLKLRYKEKLTLHSSFYYGKYFVKICQGIRERKYV